MQALSHLIFTHQIIREYIVFVCYNAGPGPKEKKAERKLRSKFKIILLC